MQENNFVNLADILYFLTKLYFLNNIDIFYDFIQDLEQSLKQSLYLKDTMVK